MAWNMRLTVNPRADKLIGDELEAMLEEKLGPAILANAVRTVPTLSFDLRNSLNYEVTRKPGAEASLIVGVDKAIHDVDYGTFVEDGTSIMAAQPYLRPAVYQAQGAIK